MGTHPIFESDFDCLTEILTDDEDISVELNGMFKADLEGSGNVEEEALFELSSTNSWLIIGSAVVLVMGGIFLITYCTSQKAKRDHKKSVEYRGGKLDINV